MNNCEVQSTAWNEKKRRSREVAELIAQPLSKVDNFIYITLAKESPIRVLDSDEDYYNSFNEQETDICHDSSDISDTDTESQYSSLSQHSLDDPIETIARMQVVEYEVASVTETECYPSEEASSGTDDYVLAAFAQAVADNSSVSEFAILADTEESDDQTWDSDFAPADYWKCVKCNNKQNNPMYRYCERCYQVRKSLFPPRPKQKRKLRFDVATKDGELSDSSLSSTSSIITKSTVSRISPVNLKTKLVSHGSPDECCSTSGSVSGTDFMFDDTSRDHDQLKRKNGVSKQDTSSNDLRVDNGLSRIYTKSVFRKNNKRKVQDNTQMLCIKKRRDGDDMDDSKCTSVQLSVFKDSGFSSSSSQERTSLEEKNILLGENSSQDVIKPSKSNQTASSHKDTLLMQSFSCTTLSQISNVSKDSVLGSYKEDAYENKSEILCDSQSSDFNINNSNLGSGLGNCMFCLSEPKNSVFVHSNFVHLCCCYKCAVKIWKQRKACPICNCKIYRVPDESIAKWKWEILDDERKKCFPCNILPMLNVGGD